MKSIQIKRATLRLTQEHNAKGESFVPLDRTDGVPVVDLTCGLVVQGARLRAGKDVRAWMFNHPKRVKARRDRTALWTHYDEEDDTSAVGVAVYVRPSVAERLSRREDFLILEHEDGPESTAQGGGRVEAEGRTASATAVA